MASSNTSTINHALEAVPAHAREFSWHTHASLWFSLGVGLLVMQVGAYLVPAAGTRDAALATAVSAKLPDKTRSNLLDFMDVPLCAFMFFVF